MENNIDYKKMYEQERERRINSENAGYKNSESELKSSEKIFMHEFEKSGINKVAKQFEEQAKAIEKYLSFISSEEFLKAYNSWNDKNK